MSGSGTVSGLYCALRSLLPQFGSYDPSEHGDTPVVLLGVCVPASSVSLLPEWSRIPYMTYRKDLYQLLGNTYSSDVGWGCMLRVIQMIIAQAILRAVEHKDPLDHVITLVLDVADKDIAPLSIYNLLEQEIPGKWFGPHHAAYNASKCLKAYKNPPIDVIVCQDGLVVESTLKPKSCILITLQLGLEAINPCYYELIYKCLGFRLSIGIAGAKPRAAYYLVGYHGNRILYLDPHKTQTAISLEQIKQGVSFDSLLNRKVFSWSSICEEKTDNEFFRFTRNTITDLKNSYFCKEIRAISISDLDPCMSFGFYVNDENDILELKNFILSMSKEPYAVFSLCKNQITKIANSDNKAIESFAADDEEDDDYVIL